MGIFLILLNIVLGSLNLYVSDGADFNLFIGVLSLCVASWMIGMRTCK